MSHSVKELEISRSGISEFFIKFQSTVNAFWSTKMWSPMKNATQDSMENDYNNKTEAQKKICKINDIQFNVSRYQ